MFLFYKTWLIFFVNNTLILLYSLDFLFSAIKKKKIVSTCPWVVVKIKWVTVYYLAHGQHNKWLKKKVSYYSYSNKFFGFINHKEWSLYTWVQAVSSGSLGLWNLIFLAFPWQESLLEKVIDPGSKIHSSIWLFPLPENF
jgi:hypothetical protein